MFEIEKHSMVNPKMLVFFRAFQQQLTSLKKEFSCRARVNFVVVEQRHQLFSVPLLTGAEESIAAALSDRFHLRHFLKIC